MTMFFVDANLEIILNENDLIKIYIQIIKKIFKPKIKSSKKL